MSGLSGVLGVAIFSSVEELPTQPLPAPPPPPPPDPPSVSSVLEAEAFRADMFSGCGGRRWMLRAVLATAAAAGVGECECEPPLVVAPPLLVATVPASVSTSGTGGVLWPLPPLAVWLLLLLLLLVLLLQLLLPLQLMLLLLVAAVRSSWPPNKVDSGLIAPAAAVPAAAVLLDVEACFSISGGLAPSLRSHSELAGQDQVLVLNQD